MVKQFQQYIDGQFLNSTQTFESINPADASVWATMPAASSDDVNRAVQAAHHALSNGQWPLLNATQRGKLLYRLAQLLEDNADTIAQLETQDTGKIKRETRAQILYIADYYRYYAGLADKVHGHHYPVDKQDMEVYSRREPIGVVAAIVPWNSQLFLSAVKLGPALAAGCTVVLKASEEAPAPLLEFARLVHEAGFPAGVVNVITGFAQECGFTLTSHPLVSRIAFTGGPETARHIVRNSSQNLASTSLELGGKSPIIIFADADLESAANAIVSGIFAASGQSCVAGSRLLVHKSIHAPLMKILVQKAQAIRLGDPQDLKTEMGPLATERQLQRIENLIQLSTDQGARILTGGSRAHQMGKGFYFNPTILDCDHDQLPCVQQEFFGPVLSVLQFEDEAQALLLANNTAFGLASGVFTKDIARAQRMVKKIRAGIVWVNTYRAISPLVPFGGFGLSGYGREAGFESILDYSRSKAVWINTSDQAIADPFVMR